MPNLQQMSEKCQLQLLLICNWGDVGHLKEPTTNKYSSEQTKCTRRFPNDRLCGRPWGHGDDSRSGRHVEQMTAPYGKCRVKCGSRRLRQARGERDEKSAAGKKNVQVHPWGLSWWLTGISIDTRKYRVNRVSAEEPKTHEIQMYIQRGDLSSFT